MRKEKKRAKEKNESKKMTFAASSPTDETFYQIQRGRILCGQWAKIWASLDSDLASFILTGETYLTDQRFRLQGRRGIGALGVCVRPWPWRRTRNGVGLTLHWFYTNFCQKRRTIKEKDNFSLPIHWLFTFSCTLRLEYIKSLQLATFLLLLNYFNILSDSHGRRTKFRFVRPRIKFSPAALFAYQVYQPR